MLFTERVLFLCKINLSFDRNMENQTVFLEPLDNVCPFFISHFLSSLYKALSIKDRCNDPTPFMQVIRVYDISILTVESVVIASCWISLDWYVCRIVFAMLFIEASNPF